MPLPHPHGNAAGQIGHNSIYDTGVTPGSTGGKFIGFGEEGTSAVANRSHWALSENIDYLYQSVSKEIAVPAGYNRTSPGGGESSYQFPAGEEIWVGDNTYPGAAGASDPEGMEMLFAVLDDQYNELTDGSGNEIRVKMVRESGGVTDVYQGGSPFLDSFQTQPIIYFYAVDPVTGVPVTDPYTIPAATDYKIMCGIKSSLENLPTDAMIRFKVQSASEVQAGAFLQDGSRKMTGDGDWDGNKLINPLEVVGGSAADLLIRSQQNLNLQGDQLLRLKDQYLASPLSLSQSGVSALYQPATAKNSSLVGALSSQVRTSEVLTGNRCLDRTGTFTPTAGANVNYPALKVIINGEYAEYAAGAAVAYTGAGTYHMFISPTGLIGLGEVGVPASVPTGSIIIWQGDYDGAVTWSDTYDLRWPSTRKGNLLSIYVGDAYGVDFTSIDDAMDFARYAGYRADNLAFEVVVVGTATASKQILLPSGWTLRGTSIRGYVDNPHSSVIKTTTTFTTTQSLISANYNCTIKDLVLDWAHTSSHQSNGFYYAIFTSAGCVIENVSITSTGGYRWNNGIYCNIAGEHGTLVRGCKFASIGNNWDGSAIIAAARTIIENCHFYLTTECWWAIDAGATGTSGDDTRPEVSVRNCTFASAGFDGDWIRVSGMGTLIENCSGNLGGMDFVSVDDYAGQSFGGVTVRNCYVTNGNRFISSLFIGSNPSFKCKVVIENNFIESFSSTAIYCTPSTVNNGSSLIIRDNTISGCTGLMAQLGGFYHILFAGNKIVDHTGDGMQIGANSNLIVDGNWFEGWGAGNLFRTPSALSNGIKFINNYVGAPTFSSSIALLIDSPNAYIAGNHFDGGGTNAATCINVRDNHVRIVGNYFTGYTFCYANLDGVFGKARYGVVADNTFDGGITADDAAAVRLMNGAQEWSVRGNNFRNLAKLGIAAWNVAGCAIADNTFIDVACGYTTTFPSACILAGFASRSVTITGNTINAFGTTTPPTFLSMYGIRCDAPYSVVSGNTVREAIGSGEGVTGGTLYDSATCIDVSGEACVCNNNFVRHTFGSNDPMASMYGIRQLGQGGSCVGNIVWFTGSAVNPGGMFAGSVGVDMSNSHYMQACIGNMIYGSWATGGSSDIGLSADNSGSVVGNISMNETIDISETTALAACNVLKSGASGSFFVNAYPSNVAYNVNTNNPKLDFNRIL